MITPSSKAPGYRELAETLRDQIRAEELAPGARLPSETALMQTHGVARLTVRRAVAQLRTEGLVDVEFGRGTTVRRQEPKTPVSAGRGSTVESWMPTPEERAEHDMPEGVPLLIVLDAGGRERGRYPAHLYVIRCS